MKILIVSTAENISSLVQIETWVIILHLLYLSDNLTYTQLREPKNKKKRHVKHQN